MAGDAANIVLGVIIEKAIAPTLDVIVRHLGYLFCYKSNIKDLKRGVVELEKSKNDADRFFKGNKRNNEETAESSTGWLEEVKEVIKLSKEVEDRTTKLKGCLNLKGRYVLGRKSTKLAAEIRTLKNKAPKGITSNSVLPAGMLQGAAANEVSKGYKTRMQTIDEVKKAFVDNAIRVIGICGLGGVWKTTMVHEVRAWARKSNLIDDFAMTSVSKDQNLFKIQGDLAEMLGLTKLKEEDNVIARADQLYKRLTNGNKVLVVLDDVWSDIKLKDIGVPFESELTKCKVIITSRQERVCSDIQKSIKVNELDREESRALFRKTAGEEMVEKSNLKKIADDLADECGGLPIALLTLSRALSNKDKRAWEDALEHLRHNRLIGIEGMKKEVYDSIKLSYDFLASEKKEAQLILLICCQHQEDATINVEMLAEYCLAMELFEGVTGVVQSRNRTYSLIEYLKSCFLLQAVDFLLEAVDADYKKDADDYVSQKWRDEEVKVHDTIRDVCLSIVSRMKKEKDVVHLQIMEQGIDDVYKIDTTNVDYPKLKLSVIYGETIMVLQQKGELRVLDCNGQKWGSGLAHISDFQILANLRMLVLGKTSISEDKMDEVMKLRKLEILRFRSSHIDCLLSGLGQLSNLKLLDLRCGYNHGLVVPIPSGVLGGLTKLEVLYMGTYHFAEKSFKLKEEFIEGGRETRISELDSLTNLTTLQILMLDPVGLLGLKNFRFDKLESFHFGSAGRQNLHTINYWSLGPLLMKTIQLEKTRVEWVLEDKIQPIVSSCLELRLDEIKDWTDPLIIKSFGSLRKLEIHSCHKLEYIISKGSGVFKNLEILSIENMSNVSALCHNRHLPEAGGSLYKLQKLLLRELSKMRHMWVGPTDPLCLLNLTFVEISNCRALEYIFPYSAIKCLLQLVHLDVSNCGMLTKIVSKGREEKVGGKEEEITEEPNDLQIHFPKLRDLFIWQCESLESFYNLDRMEQPLFNSLVMLPSIEQLYLYQNDSIKAVFDIDGLEARGMRKDECLLFSELQSIRLLELSKLEHMCRQVPKNVIIFQNLRILEVKSCDRLSYLIPSFLPHLLVNIEDLEIKWCADMKEVFCNMDEEEEGGELKKKFVFDSLNKVELESLDNILSFCSSDHQVLEFPSLEEISIRECPRMQTFCCQKPRIARSLMLDEKVSKGEGTITEGGGGINNVSNDLLDQFPKLKRVLIYDAPDFRGLLHNHNSDEGTLLTLSYPQFMLPSIEKLELDGSQLIIAVFDFEGSEGVTVREDPQALLCALKVIQIQNLPNLEHLCTHVPKDVQIFQNLRDLSLENCGSLTYVLPSSIAHMLGNLLYLTVKECEDMKEIISIMNLEDCGKLEKKTGLRSLTFLELSDLENLSSFCSSDQLVFELPSLKTLWLTNTPDFRGFYNLDNDKSRRHPLYRQMVVLPSMVELKVYQLAELKQIVGNDISSFAASFDSLNNLQKLDICECDSLISVFDFDWKQIIEETPVLDYKANQVKREDAHNILGKLESMSLQLLQDLENICTRLPKEINGFQNLRSLRVYGCYSLSYLFTSTMAHMLLNLEFLMVWECESMKEVIKMEEDCDRNKIVFRSLSRVEILSMDNLSSFCASELQEFDFPSLERVYIVKCPAITTFCYGNLTAEKLQGIYFDDNNFYDDYRVHFNRFPDRAYHKYDVSKVFWNLNVNETVRHFNARLNRMTDLNEYDDDVEQNHVDDVGDIPISKNVLDEFAQNLNPISSSVIQISSPVREDGVDDIHTTAEDVDTEYDQFGQESSSYRQEKFSRAPVVISSSPPVANNKREMFSFNSHQANPLETAMMMTTMTSSQSTPENEQYKLKDKPGEIVLKAIEVSQSSFDDAKNESDCTSELVPNTSGQADSSAALALWRGHMVTSKDKELLESVEKHFPGTYDGVKFHTEVFWKLALDSFCCCLSKFLVANVTDLSSKEVTELRGMLLDLMEKFNFNLEWALNRLDKVEKLRLKSPFPGELAEIERQRAPLLIKLEHLKAELQKLDVLRETKLKMLIDEFGSGSLALLEGSLGRDLLPSYQSV